MNYQIFFLLIFCLSAPMYTVGQNEIDYDNTGDILVTITNEASRPLEDSTVIAESRTGEQYEAVSNAEGQVVFSNLTVGLYRVLVEKNGFISSEEPDIRVVRGKKVPVDLTLLRDRNENIEEVVVIGSAFHRDAHGGVSASYLDREHLRTATGGGADVMRALDGLPGLFSTGEFANFTVRGRGPRDNLILIDGFPYDRVVHFDEALGEQEDIGGGGRFSIFAPN